MVYKYFCDLVQLLFRLVWGINRVGRINKQEVPLFNMAIRARENLVAARAFLVGVILAVLLGVFAGDKINSLIIGILAILGVIVGYFVADKNVQTFLLASVSLVLVSYSGISGLVINSAVLGTGIASIVSATLGALLALFVPATIIVALKTVFSIAKS